MSNLKTIGIYSFRILFRQWKKFILPFFSLTFTTVIVFIVLLFTTSSSLFLEDKNKELVGGDISITSNYEVPQERLDTILGEDINVVDSSSQYDFSGILTRGDITTPVSITVVDTAYPVYGGLTIVGQNFESPKEYDIYIDARTQNKLGVQVGQDVMYANTVFTVKGIIEKDSNSLLSGFTFLPKVLISKEGFTRTTIDKALLRSEYTYVYVLENTTTATLQSINSRAKNLGVQINIAGITESGLVQGLSVVKQFLILAVLLSCMLSAVNIYAAMLYLLSVMKKSFAVMVALGFNKKKLALTLVCSLFYILVASILVGGVLSIVLFNYILGYISNTFDLVLPFVGLWIPLLLTFLVVFSISFSSFVPSLHNLLKLNPKILLSGGQEIKEKNIFTQFIVVTVSALLPLVIIATLFLDSFLYGVLSIASSIALYVVLAVVFYFLMAALYKKRHIFKFLTRTLISYKHADGLFGIVSLTSLYVALTSLCLLILLQSSISNFIKNDVGEKVPSVYVVDIQKSQTQSIRDSFKNVTLFPNVGARIISIDNLDIQTAIALSDGSVSREFGREYNLTYRKDLLQSEKIDTGTWLSGIPNEVSVEKDFADRANIDIGSVIVFSISGFPVESVVTSIRESDSRSGLPFFYFVFNPSDLEKYPATFFGYTYLDDTEKNTFTNFLATNFPNVSIIDTADIKSFAENIADGFLIIIFVIALPPLVLALFLIVTLIISSFTGRRRQSAQLMALGLKKRFIERLYYLETISTTLVAGILGYSTAVLGTLFITNYYLKIQSNVFFDIELIVALGGILVVVFVVATVLWRSDKKPLRELLSHEE